MPGANRLASITPSSGRAIVYQKNSVMKTIVDLRISSPLRTPVTPVELLEDFAHRCAFWDYLEEESKHYAALKGRPACVIRSMSSEFGDEVDYGFAATHRDDLFSVRLFVVDPIGRTAPLDVETRSRIVAHFLDDFQSYLGNRPHLAQIQTVELETEDNPHLHSRPATEQNSLRREAPAKAVGSGFTTMKISIPGSERGSG
jgi:hypothetical protein